MHIYLWNDPAKFHPNPILSDGALGFCEDIAPTKQQEQKQEQYEIGS